MLQVPTQATQDEVSTRERKRRVDFQSVERGRRRRRCSVSSTQPRPRPPPPPPSHTQIRRAYLAAARKAHPDLGGSASEFKRVADAYAALSSRGGLTFPSSSSAYSHYHRASASAYAHAASLRPPRASFSNVTLALVLSVPLALAGVAAAHANSAHGGGGIASGSRPHGLLSPPVNEFLSEERHARVAPSRLAPTLREVWGGGGGGGRGWQWGR